MAPLLKLLLVLPAVLSVLAAPAPRPLFGINFGDGTESDGTPTTVAQNTIDATLLRPALFSRAAYCSPASVATLSCGAPCDAINAVKVLQSGGDEGEIPRCTSFASCVRA